MEQIAKRLPFVSTALICGVDLANDVEDSQSVTILIVLTDEFNKKQIKIVAKNEADLLTKYGIEFEKEVEHKRLLFESKLKSYNIILKRLLEDGKILLAK